MFFKIEGGKNKAIRQMGKWPKDVKIRGLTIPLVYVWLIWGFEKVAFKRPF